MARRYAKKAEIHTELALSYRSIVAAEEALARFIKVLESVEKKS